MSEVYDSYGNDWRIKAECRNADWDLFFAPDRQEHKLQKMRRVEAAKKVCGKCAVKLICREWAIDTGQEYGIWGGMTEEELRNRVRARHGSIEVG